MKLVTLVRHAKALPLEPNYDDEARALSDSGRETATRIGQELIDFQPELVLCSPSQRTRETRQLASSGWHGSVETTFDEALYLAHAMTLLDRITQVPDAVSKIWLVGHNPGLHDLARQFAEWAGHDAVKQAFYQHFPPAAYASFRFETDEWASLERSRCHFEASLRRV